MESLIVAIVTGVASFVGSWAAFKVHLSYLRRDVDKAHARIDRIIEGRVHHASL